jgi:hypothetical protein
MKKILSAIRSLFADNFDEEDLYDKIVRSRRAAEAELRVAEAIR